MVTIARGAAGGGFRNVAPNTSTIRANIGLAQQPCACLASIELHLPSDGDEIDGLLSFLQDLFCAFSPSLCVCYDLFDVIVIPSLLSLFAA